MGNNSHIIQESLHSLRNNILAGNEFVASEMLPLLASLKEPTESGGRVISGTHEICLVLNRFNTSLDVIKTSIVTLEGVPGLDVVIPELRTMLGLAEKFLAPVKNTLSTLDKDLLKPAESLFHKLQQVTTTLDSSLSEFSHHVPEYVHTLNALEVLINVLPLFNAEASSSAGEGPVDKIEREIALAIESAHRSIEGVHSLMTEALQTGKELLESLSRLMPLVPQINGALDSIKSAVGWILPIADEIAKIEDAIAPLKFLLDAASYVVKTLIEEPVQKLLDFFGLEQKLEALTTELMNALTGPIDFLRKMEELLPTELIERALKTMGDECALAISAGLQEADQAIKPFLLSNTASWRETLSTLTHDAIGVDIGKDGTLTLKSWTAPGLTPSSARLVHGDL